MHSRPCAGVWAHAWSCAWVCCLCVASATIALSSVPVHGRASSVPLPLALRGLYSTSILPCIHLKICPSHQNHKIPHVSEDNSHCKHNWIQEVKLDPFSSRFRIKVVINMDQTRAKMKSNIGTTRCFLVLTHWANADQVINLIKTNLWMLMHDHLTSYQSTLIRLLKVYTWTNLFLITNSKYDKCDVITNIGV